MSAATVVFMIVIFGYFSFTVPAAAISIDINPSMELKINMYDKVIDVSSYNSEGEDLAETLNLKNLNYSDAVNTVLNNDFVLSCIESDELVEITVTGRFENMVENMRKSISEQSGIPEENIYCLSNSEMIKSAHEAGISFGKYRAYLELYELDPDVTIEDISDLTMRQIREMINMKASGDLNFNGQTENGSSQNGNGYGNGNGNGNRFGNADK